MRGHEWPCARHRLQVQTGISAERDPLDALAMRYIVSASQGELQVLLPRGHP